VKGERAASPPTKGGSRGRLPYEIQNANLPYANTVISFAGSASTPTRGKARPTKTKFICGRNRLVAPTTFWGLKFVGSASPPTEGATMERRRKNIRLPKETYETSSQIFSITICTQDRRPLFQNETWGKNLLDSLKRGPLEKQTEQYAWCLMPDHLHLLIASREGNISDILNAWKSYTAHLLKKEGLKGTCWQRGFYDHALRKEEDIQKVADYIVNNPVRKGLVENWRDYPFSWHRWM